MNKMIRELGTIVCVWAHPDDETFCMAGILATAIRNGQKVVCITATRGESGIRNENRWPANRLAAIRTQELQAALKVLGVTNHVWLDYPDGGCASVSAKAAADKIASIIKKHKPDSLFTFGPDGLTGHEDHVAVSGWTNLAKRQTGSQAVVYHAVHTVPQYKSTRVVDKTHNIYFNIKNPPIHNECDCDICYELPGDIYEQKIAALLAMPSQMDSILEEHEHLLPGMFGTEAFRRCSDVE